MKLTTLPGRAWARLVAFVQEREDGRALALTRIIACATVFFHVAHMLTSGAALFVWTRASSFGLGNNNGHGLIGALEDILGDDRAAVLSLCALCLLASLCGALGVVTRVSVLMTYATFRALYGITADARCAYDGLLTNALFLLVLASAGAALSLDTLLWRRHPRVRALVGAGDENHLVTRWPRMLLVCQMGFLYGGSALMKASSGWVPGGDASALWYILQQPLWTRFADLPAWTYPLTQVATTVVWCFELCGPLFVLAVFARESRSARFARVARVFVPGYLVIGVGMHLGIELFMEVGAFTGAALAFYPCALRPSWGRHSQPLGVQQNPPAASRLVASVVNE
ncbi:MAG TPA: hypothetical protein VGO62_18360 [Myxococcota bacterium]|jgi:hypothetical protein